MAERIAGPFGRIPRRGLLRSGVGTLFGLGLPQWLAARTDEGTLPVPSTFGRARSCILLFMWGGPAQHDTWDLKPDAPAEIRGEFKPISTNVSGIQVCEHFQEMSRRMDKLALVRSMTHNNVDHTTATHFLLTGQPPPPTGNLDDDWPHVGTVLARLGRGTQPLPPFVSMRPTVEGDVPRFVEQSHGQFGGWLGKAWNPLTIDANPALADYRVGEFDPLPEVAAERARLRQALLSAVDRVGEGNSTAEVMRRQYERAFDLLASAAAGGAFDLEQEPQAVRERYGLNPHGQSVLQARRLIEAGVSLVTVYWPNDGIKNVSVYWDTHQRNFIDLKERLIPASDRALAALLDDLEARGLLDETLVVWTGEFGRTPRIGQRNSDAGAGSDGRDHWPGCFTTVLAGAGVRGGTVYGRSDRHAAWPAADPVAPVDLVATAYHLLGVSSDLSLTDSSGRQRVVCPGSVIPALLE